MCYSRRKRERRARCSPAIHGRANRKKHTRPERGGINSRTKGAAALIPGNFRPRKRRRCDSSPLRLPRHSRYYDLALSRAGRSCRSLSLSLLFPFRSLSHRAISNADAHFKLSPIACTPASRGSERETQRLAIHSRRAFSFCGLPSDPRSPPRSMRRRAGDPSSSRSATDVGHNVL